MSETQTPIAHAAVAQRLRQRDEDEGGDVALRIAELLDDAAQKIERL